MAIVKTVNSYDFERAFVDAGRGDNFSYEGKQILFDYLENLSEEMGEPIELDVIALCCDYSEMSLEDLLNYYDGLGLEIDDELEIYPDEDDVLEALMDHTSVCGSYYCNENETYFFVFQSF